VTALDGCWICGDTATAPVDAGDVADALTPDDLRITDKRYGLTLPLVRCGACGFVYASGSGRLGLASLYAELDDDEYGASAEARRRQMAHLLRWAMPGRARPGRLLDVGAASGILLAEAAAAGFDGVGVEPSLPLAARAREHGLDVHDGVLPHPELDGEVFDVVTLVDVIEHVDDPLDLLRRCREHLAPGGRLVVVTPDQGSVAARALGRRWWHRRLAHVGYFDRSTLTLALQRTGFAAERWGRPRWYFPVGYLATRVGQYVPGAGRRRATTPPSDGTGRAERAVVPLNLRDSLAVVARAA
jgi:SAM-dependent methyltransferase